MSENSGSELSDTEPQPGTSGMRKLTIPDENTDDESSTSESDIGAYSTSFNPKKALFSDRIMLPVPDAPVYENLQQFEAAMKQHGEILAVGKGQQVLQREQRKAEKKLEYERAIQEINKNRFARFEATVKPEKRAARNVLTREDNMQGPLGALRRCMKDNLRVKILIRGPRGVRGEIHANITAFDKHWNMVLTNVLEIYKKKSSNKLKVPPPGGRPVEKGTANMISAIPLEVETSIGGRLWECVRHVPQLLVRGEHVVLVNIVDQ